MLIDLNNLPKGWCFKVALETKQGDYVSCNWTLETTDWCRHYRLNKRTDAYILPSDGTRTKLFVFQYYTDACDFANDMNDSWDDVFVVLLCRCDKLEHPPSQTLPDGEAEITVFWRDNPKFRRMIRHRESCFPAGTLVTDWVEPVYVLDDENLSVEV